jgi:hypothetical protein
MTVLVRARRFAVLGAALAGLVALLAIGVGSANASVRKLKLRGSTTAFPSPTAPSGGDNAAILNEDGTLRWVNRSDSPRPKTQVVNGRRTLAPAAVPSWLPTVSPTAVHAGSAGLLTSWEGLNEFDNRQTAGFSVEPPDQGLCVGNGYVFEAINDVVRVYQPNGAGATPAVSLNAFFGYDDVPFLTDPSCLYDAGTGRFYVSELTLEVNPSTGQLTGKDHIDLAVSKSSDPTGGWWLYSIPATDTGGANGPLHKDCPCIGDYPHIGTDSHGLFVTTNEYPFTDAPGIYGNNFNGAQVYAMSKTALANGNALLPIVQFDNTSVKLPGNNPRPGFTLWPTTNPGTGYATANNGTEYFASSMAAEEARPTDFNGHASSIALWQITNTASLDDPNPAVTLKGFKVASEPYGVPPVSAQKTGPTPLRECLQQQCRGDGNPYQSDSEGGLDSSDSRMLTAWYVNGRVLAALDTVMSVNGSLQAGPAWFSIKPPGPSGAPSMAGQGYVGVAGNNVIMPSIATTTAGTGAMALTLAGADHFPSAAYATLNPAGPGDVYTAAEGAAPEDGFCEYTFYNCGQTATPTIRPRWGDYGAATFDGTNLWVASEYIAHSCTFAQFDSDTTCGGTRTYYGNFSTRISKLSPAGF